LFQVSTWSIVILAIIVAIIVAVFTIFSVIWVIRAHRRRVSAGKEDLIGRTAVVDTALEPKGVVTVEGERWTAISDAGHIEPDAEVIVTRVEGLKMWVTKKE